MIKDVGKQGKSRRTKIGAIIVRAPGLPFFRDPFFSLLFALEVYGALSKT